MQSSYKIRSRQYKKEINKSKLNFNKRNITTIIIINIIYNNKCCDKRN